jgi:hypothetical protein
LGRGSKGRGYAVTKKLSSSEGKPTGQINYDDFIRLFVDIRHEGRRNSRGRNVRLAILSLKWAKKLRTKVLLVSFGFTYFGNGK